MAAGPIQRIGLLTACCVAGLVAIATETRAQTQNFTMRVQYAQVFTDAFPQGFVDSSPPYTLCRNNAITFRFRYTWLHPFQEYVYTEANPSPWPYYYVQGVSENPLFVPAAQPGNPVTKLVDVGLIAGSVNTGGSRQLSFRGRTSGFFGNPVQTASTSVLVETQIEPPPTQYAEIVDGTLDMPTRPWLRWADSLAAERRLDIGICSSPGALTPDTCGSTTLPGVPTTYYNDCGSSAYCWVGTDYRHQVGTALAPNTAHQYRVLGRNMCGVSDEFGSTPRRPFFKTAQACFVVPAGAIPDGGVRHFDAATLTQGSGPPGSPGPLAADLRVTIHSDHSDVSDLRISLTKTSPVAAGPLLLMDRPTGTNCVNGKRIQTAFADNGTSLAAGCSANEPAINRRTAPLQALASFAPLEGAGTWRLTIEDTQVDGNSGSLLEWCLSTDPQLPPLQAAAFVNPMMFANGFE